jgi:hypothetical protein
MNEPSGTAEGSPTKDPGCPEGQGRYGTRVPLQSGGFPRIDLETFGPRPRYSGPPPVVSPRKQGGPHDRPTGTDTAAIEPEAVEPAEVVAATAAAQQTETAADAAEHEVQSISERIEILQQNIGLARQLRDTAHQKVDNADQTSKSRSEDLFREMMEGANTDALKQQIQEATERVREARTESRTASKQLDELQSALAAL